MNAVSEHGADDNRQGPAEPDMSVQQDSSSASIQRLLPRSITALLAGGMGLLVCNAVSLWTNLRAIDEAVALVDHTWTVIDHLHGINTLITGAQESQRSYLALSDEVELEALPDVKRDMTNKLAGLDRLVAAVH